MIMTYIKMKKDLDNLQVGKWLSFEYFGREVEIYWRYIDKLYFVAVEIEHTRVATKKEVIDFIVERIKKELENDNTTRS